jgi:hypothetical protein
MRNPQPSIRYGKGGSWSKNECCASLFEAEAGAGRFGRPLIFADETAVICPLDRDGSFRPQVGHLDLAGWVPKRSFVEVPLKGTQFGVRNLDAWTVQTSGLAGFGYRLLTTP